MPIPETIQSVAALNLLRHQLGIDLHIAHINHQLRRTAGTDERFVKSVADRLQLPFHSKRVTIRRTSKKSSLEDVARDARQKALFQIAEKNKITKIALAHTQDDLAETVLMRIIRGTGLDGIQGIIPCRQFGKFTIVRPLLSVTRKQIEQFLLKHKVTYRTDPTNKQTVFFRNKIRLKLLPFLEREFNPGVKQALTNLAQTTAYDYDTLNLTAQKYYAKYVKEAGTKKLIVPLASLKNIPVSIRRILFRRACTRLTKNPHSFSLQHILEIEDLIVNRPLNAVVHLPLGIAAQKKKGQLVFTARKA